MNLLLLLVVVLFSLSIVESRVVRQNLLRKQDAASLAVSSMPTVRVAVGKHAVTFRLSVERDGAGDAHHLDLVVEANDFRDSQYLAIGFNSEGSMAPALALGGLAAKTLLSIHRVVHKHNEVFFRLHAASGEEERLTNDTVQSVLDRQRRQHLEHSARTHERRQLHVAARLRHRCAAS